MKNASLVRVICALSFVVPAAVAAAPRAASACGTEIYLESDSKTMLVAKAEQLLSQGKLAKAAQKAVEAFPALKIVKVGSTHLSDRGLRILALAASRADGGVTVGTMRGTKSADREANLEWSVETLKTLDARRPNNPALQTDLAEAMSRVPAHRAEALKRLAELADKDLLTSAEGYAALARLRAAAGDAPARDAAVKRCETMTKSPAEVCAVPAVASDSTGRS